MTTAAKKPVVLLVDDQPRNIDLLGNILDGLAILKVATSGERALEMAKAGPIDLILLDIEMPDLNGYEVCRRLKADPGLASITVIFATARDQEGDEIRGFDVGAVDYVTKPFSPALVRARVQAHLAMRRAQAELEAQNEQLRDYLRLREEVERITRHDLKGPLTPIIEFPCLMLSATNLTEDQKECLLLIRSSGYRLLTMINQSLDLLKMEMGTYRLKPAQVDLLAIVRTLTRDMETLASTRASTLELSCEGNVPDEGATFMVTGEEGLIYTLLGNLLKNAWEATPEGKPVRLDLRTCPWAEIVIENHGVVPEKIRDSFFQKYVTMGKKGGTGLGAYSASLMTRTMHGTLAMETLGEERTRLILCLPGAGGQLPPALPVPENVSGA